MKARKIIKRNTETLYGFKPESGCDFLHEGIIQHGDFVKRLSFVDGNQYEPYIGWQKAEGIIGWEVKDNKAGNNVSFYIVCRPKT